MEPEDFIPVFKAKRLCYACNGGAHIEVDSWLYNHSDGNHENEPYEFSFKGAHRIVIIWFIYVSFFAFDKKEICFKVTMNCCCKEKNVIPTHTKY